MTVRVVEGQYSRGYSWYTPVRVVQEQGSIRAGHYKPFQVLSAGQQAPALALDVTSDESVASLQKLLKVNMPKMPSYHHICQERETPVTELINNAGISTPDHPHEAVGSIVRAEMMAVFNTNVAGVAAVITASGVLEERGGKVVNVSSSEQWTLD